MDVRILKRRMKKIALEDSEKKKEIKRLDAEIEKSIADFEAALYGEEVRKALKGYEEKVLFRIKELDFYVGIAHVKAELSFLILIITLIISLRNSFYRKRRR